MSKLYASIIAPDAKRDRHALTAIAARFSYGIEMLEDGVVFNVAGLDRLVGGPEQIARKILGDLKKQNIAGNVAVAQTVHSALMLAREKRGLNHAAASPAEFHQLPLESLNIENDSLGIFKELGIQNIDELRAIPVDDLVNRYGREFRRILDVVEQNNSGFLTPNVKENNVAWSYELDLPVEDFEQLIFVVNHGLDNLFRQVKRYGHSTEHLDITFKLTDKTRRDYEIKTSFPTLDKTFWLKLINLRVSMDPPEASIMAVNVLSHFTKPRPAQRGLYAGSRPEPESLLLTVGKLKKLVGDENVGVPVILNQRLAESFTLDADKLPEGKEVLETKPERLLAAFTYFRPPIKAEVLVRDARLIFLKTSEFSGHVTEYSGVWRANSKWWDKSWKTQEWDVEIENNGVYRLCKLDKDWFLAGEYD